MPDDMERVQGDVDQFHADSLAEFLRQRGPAASGRTHCMDCGIEIPMARRRAIANCRRCKDCQEILEGFKGSVR